MQPALFAIDVLAIEEAARASGYRLLAGLDEVGRGCWAGPVYAAAVILPDVCFEDRRLLAEVTDSKLLAPTTRERLAARICELALAAALGWAEAPVVDRLNILGATRLAMRAAVACLAGEPHTEGDGGAWGATRIAGAATAPDYLVVDAVRLPEIPLPQRAVVRADQSCLTVAAASIVAKVARDAEMRRRATGYPSFRFEQNKGYGTRHHFLALREHGLTPLHRRSFAPAKYLLGARDHIAGTLPVPRGTP